MACVGFWGFILFFSESISGTGLEVAGFLLPFFYPLVKAYIKKKMLFPLALLMLLEDKASSNKSPNELLKRNIF